MSDIAPSLVVFLVILGAGALVLVGYAIGHRFTARAGRSADYRDGWAGVEEGSQLGYMQAVRQRNRDEMARVFGWR